MGARAGPGRPRQFCRAACRQAAYRARQLAAGHGLADDEVVVRVEALTNLADAQYGLVAALEDVEVDLAEAVGPEEVRAALEHLVEACAPLATLRLLPETDRR
jgi:hypothetical protein